MSRICAVLGRRLSSHRAQPRDWKLAGHVPPTSLLFDDPALRIDLTEDEPLSHPHKRPAAAPTPEQWRRHREQIKKAFPDGWNPTRKLSRDAMDGLRSLHAFDKNTFSCAVLADKFKISPEAVRRILRSKWEPSREKRARLAERERRSKEEWIAKRRQEEMYRAAQVVAQIRSEATQDDKPQPRPKLSRIKSNDKLFFK